MPNKTAPSAVSRNLLYVSIVIIVVAATWCLFMMMASLYPQYEGAGFDYYDFELVGKQTLDNTEVQTVVQKKCVAFKRSKYNLADIQKDFLANSDMKLVLDDTWPLKERLNMSLYLKAGRQAAKIRLYG